MSATILNLHRLLDDLETMFFPMADDKRLKLLFERGPEVLLDILMPGLDGYQVCRQLKARERTRDIPIIFLTVISETLDLVQEFRLGAVDDIARPFEAEEVLARVSAHLALPHIVQAYIEITPFDSVKYEIDKVTSPIFPNTLSNSLSTISPL